MMDGAVPSNQPDAYGQAGGVAGADGIIRTTKLRKMDWENTQFLKLLVHSGLAYGDLSWMQEWAKLC